LLSGAACCVAAQSKIKVAAAAAAIELVASLCLFLYAVAWGRYMFGSLAPRKKLTTWFTIRRNVEVNPDFNFKPSDFVHSGFVITDRKEIRESKEDFTTTDRNPFRQSSFPSRRF